jgi:hypothetical protein
LNFVSSRRLFFSSATASLAQSTAYRRKKKGACGAVFISARVSPTVSMDAKRL